jgi:hypothetical protein
MEANLRHRPPEAGLKGRDEGLSTTIAGANCKLGVVLKVLE